MEKTTAIYCKKKESASVRAEERKVKRKKSDVNVSFYGVTSDFFGFHNERTF